MKRRTSRFGIFQPVLAALLDFVRALFRSNHANEVVILALRHQLELYRQSVKRPNINPPDRILWSILSRIWKRWIEALVIVKPKTVIEWQRRRFRKHWAKISERKGPGHPHLEKEIRDLIRRISLANALWGTPKIMGELGKLGINVAKATVDKYRVKIDKDPSPTWRTFLRNHMHNTAAIDFCTVPTVTFRVLFVFVIMTHERRKVLHFNVTEHPSSIWTKYQIREAFPWDTAPKYLLRDNDGKYGSSLKGFLKSFSIDEVCTAKSSPWQNPYVERLIGSIRRECLNNIIIINENHLRRVLKKYFSYYTKWRCHQSLEQDPPDSRPIQRIGKVVGIPEVGGLHTRFEREAA